MKTEIFGLDNQATTNKQKLINECLKHNVCIYIDNPAESSTGVYADIRGVASEAELQRRLDTNIQARNSTKAYRISILALMVSVIAAAISIYK